MSSRMRRPTSTATSTVRVVIDGEAIDVPAQRSLGALLHEIRDAGFRRTARGVRLRGLFCGMGVCFDCVVTVDGRAGVRACITPVADGMTVETATR